MELLSQFHEDVRPASSHMIELESGPPQSSLEMTATLTDTLTKAL